MSDRKITQDLIGKIKSICPFVVLKEARSKTATCNPKSLSEDFLNLDKAIHVPNNIPETRLLAQLFLDLVKHIISIVTRKNPDFDFVVIPVGSFPCNVKIGDIDEFDYILKWITRNKKIDEAFYQYHVKGQKDRGHPAEEFGFPDTLLDVIRELKNDLRLGFSEPVYSGPAANIKLSWDCYVGHLHHVSLDLTIALETNRSFCDYVISRDFPLRSSSFQGLKTLDNRINVIHKEVSYHVATNLLDDEMFSACDSVSENIRTCYRIMKFIRDYLFPVVFQKKLFNFWWSS